jgi:hypothetical protein
MDLALYFSAFLPSHILPRPPPKGPFSLDSPQRHPSQGTVLPFFPTVLYVFFIKVLLLDPIKPEKIRVFTPISLGATWYLPPFNAGVPQTFFLDVSRLLLQLKQSCACP